MRLKIIDFKEEEGGKIIISFISPYGEAKAIWKGPTPILNNEYEVELDIGETFYCDDNITRSNKEIYSIDHSESCFLINGKIESLSEDNVASIRLGDSLILVSYWGEIGKKGNYVTLKTKEIYAFNVNI